MSGRELLARVCGANKVRAAALFGEDLAPEAAGFAAEAEAFRPVASAVRHIFRQTRPAVEHLDLRFAKGRILIFSVAEKLLVVSAEDDVDASALKLVCSAESQARSSAPSLEPAVSVPTTAAVRIVLLALNEVSAEARKHIGGAVIRNYLRRSQAAAPPTSGLGRFSVDLSGKITAEGDGDVSAQVVRECGGWMRDFLVRVAVVAPDVDQKSIGRLREGPCASLSALGFFET